MVFQKTKLKPADITFSLLIRARDVYCQRCGTLGEPLDCAHFHRRGHKSVRFDPRNAILLCRDCHRLYDGALRQEFARHQEKRLGVEVLADLQQDANRSPKFGEYEFKQMNLILKEKGLGEKQHAIFTLSTP